MKENLDTIGMILKQADKMKPRDTLSGKKIFFTSDTHFNIAHLRSELIERFEHVAFEMYVVIDNQAVFLNHHPFLCYGDSHGKVWQLHGHIHSRDGHSCRFEEQLAMLRSTQYDVGVDNNDYKPISFYQIRDIMSSRSATL